ncbi:MAG: hypothetical protein Q7S13_02875 [Candidatus Omnitrophota bacterium]|nr:hypothetical protein [Candidatus Omnitrophota bacterium]
MDINIKNKYTLFLLTLFIIWLYVFGYLNYETRANDIKSQNYRGKKFDFYPGTESYPPFIVDKTSGIVRRYYRNFDNNNNLISEGFMSVDFDTPFGTSESFYPGKELADHYYKEHENKKQ